MSSHLYKCSSCHKYSMKESCPSCNAKALVPKPPKFSPQDKYGKYRREVKKEELKKKNLY